MNFKFIDNDGKEVNINNLRSFIELVKSGQIKGETLLYDEKDSKWKKASEYEEFQAVVMNLEQSTKESVSNFPFPEVNTKHKGKKLALISSSFIFIAIILLSVASAKYYTNTTEGSAYKFGQMLGYSFWFAIVSYLIWRFIFKKKEGVGFLCFSILFLSFSGYQAITMITEVRQAKIVAKDINSSVKEFISGQAHETSLKSHSLQSYGKLEPLMDWFENYLLILRQDYMDFNNAMEKEQIETILTPETLSNRSRIIEAKLKLIKINQLIDDYEKLLEKRSIDAINQINSLRLEDNIKKKAIDGFIKGRRERDEYFKEYFRIERAFLAEVNSLLNFLLSRSGKYWFENSQIVFILDNDANQYNIIIQKIYRLAEEESKLADKYQRAILSKTQEFEKLFQ
jgi:hypothetical protein